jgi:integrase
MSKHRQRGTGTVIPYKQKNGDTSWRVQFYDASGKQVKETVGKESEGWSRARVEKYLRERIHAVEKQGFKKPKPVTFAEYADRWLDENERPRAWSAGTAKKYKWAVGHWKRTFGSQRLTSAKPQQVNEFSNRLLQDEYEPRSVNLMLTVLQMIFTSAEDEGLIEEGKNPTRKMHRPKVMPYKPRALTVAEARSIESKLTDPQHRLAFLTFELLGIRMKELRGLRWGDVSLGEKRLRIEDSKTPTGVRAVAMPSPLVAEFERYYAETHYRADSDYVFAHPLKGTPFREFNYREAFRAAQKAAGVEGYIRPAHDLRVTSITSGVLAGEHPSKIMQRAGHRSYQTTRGYIDLAGEVFHDDAEAIASLRLGAGEVAQEAPEALD